MVCLSTAAGTVNQLNRIFANTSTRAFSRTCRLCGYTTKFIAFDRAR